MTTDADYKLSGVIAAAPTPVDAKYQPDLDRYAKVCRWLLDNGCDAINLTGTTGEATSLSVAQRKALMTKAAETLPLERLMVGTGAAAVEDAVELTRHAADLGLAGALLIPPFYFKNVADDGVVAYFERVVEETADKPIDLYLYNVPQFSCVEYTETLCRRLIAEFGSRMAGLKDSSGNMEYAEEIAKISPDFKVFPATEACLLRARAGEFAGCISASATITSPYCRLAYHNGDAAALETACEIRALAQKNPLVPSLKAVLAAKLDDPFFETLLPPLTPLPAAAKRELLSAIDATVEAARAAA